MFSVAPVTSVFGPPFSFNCFSTNPSTASDAFLAASLALSYASRVSVLVRLYISLDIVFVFSINSGARSFAAFAVFVNQDPKAFAADVALDRRFPKGSSPFDGDEALFRRGDWEDDDTVPSLFEYDEVVVKLRGADVESEENKNTKPEHPTYKQGEAPPHAMGRTVYPYRPPGLTLSDGTSHRLSCYTFVESVVIQSHFRPRIHGISSFHQLPFSLVVCRSRNPL